MAFREGADPSRIVITAFARVVVALDAPSGRELWRREVGDDSGQGIRIEVSEGHVLAVAAGKVHLVELATGRPVWEIGLPPQAVGSGLSMLRVGSTLYVSRGGVLSSVDLDAGVVRWTNTLPQTGHGAAAIGVPGQVVQGDVAG